MDDIDRACVRETEDRERALAAHRQRVAASFLPRDAAVDNLCIECDMAIEPARLKALSGATSRCAACAHDFEQRSRGRR